MKKYAETFQKGTESEFTIKSKKKEHISLLGPRTFAIFFLGRMSRGTICNRVTNLDYCLAKKLVPYMRNLPENTR